MSRFSALRCGCKAEGRAATNLLDNSTILDDVQVGRMVIASISRAVIEAAARGYGTRVSVHVMAREEILERRLTVCGSSESN
jgi:ribose 1,5-bisphosphokinase PhnN